MKKIIYLVILLTCFYLIKNVFTYQSNFIAKIQWKNGYIKSIGEHSIKYDKNGLPINFKEKNISLNQLRMIGYRNARKEAIEYLVNEARNIQIDNNYKLKDIINQSAYTQKKFSFLINNNIIIKEYPTGFFKLKCIAKLKISDLLTVLPFDFPNNDFPVFNSIKFKTDYTALIIDTRGLKIKPMLFPSIYDENGLEIYNRYFINIKAEAVDGIAAYVYNEREAAENKRAGKKPYYAIAFKKVNKSPVILLRDVKRIFSSSKTLENLKRCKLIIIIDK